ncbi:hypothetical protein LJC48_03010 [Desulfovibrio sp. OttesenSCG-928-C06]|nr:hypothetical protein [Desulfovibrio sp. OttesenSCG-928-C06]
MFDQKASIFFNFCAFFLPQKCRLWLKALRPNIMSFSGLSTGLAVIFAAYGTSVPVCAFVYVKNLKIASPRPAEKPGAGSVGLVNFAKVLYAGRVITMQAMDSGAGF